MINILITGGAGFIASCLCDSLIKNPHYQVIAVDNFLTGSKLKISTSDFNNFHFIEGDVNDREFVNQLFENYRFDYIFHYAAVVGVQRTLQQPLEVLKDVEGFKNIFDNAAQHHIKRIFYSSSSEVYGESVELPQRELTTPLNSRLPYAIVKNLGEAYCRSYHQEYGLDYTIFRFFNTYGPKQSTDFVITKFLNQALHNIPISIYGSGLQTRTFCHYQDNIDACINAFEQNKFINEVINIGNDSEVSVLELAKIILKKTQSSAGIHHLNPLEEGDMPRRQPEISHMKELLQRPLTELENGIDQIINSAIFYQLNNLSTDIIVNRLNVAK